MGVTATFAVLETLPPERQRVLAEAALREPYPELQAAAFAALADPKRIDRPDLVVLHYPDLLPELKDRVAAERRTFEPAARELLNAPQDRARRSALTLLAALGEFEAVPVLIEAVADPSTLVRDSAINLIEGLAGRYRYHLVNAGAHGDPVSRKYVDERRPAMLKAIDAMLRAGPARSGSLFLDLALESGEDGRRLLADGVLSRPGTPAHRMLLDTLQAAAAEPAVDFLFGLLLEADARLRETAVRILQSRRDPAFAAMAAAALGRMDPERRAELAKRGAEPPWWPAVEAAPDLPPPACSTIMDFLAGSGIEAGRRHALLLFFHGSRFPAVRARSLSLLFEQAYPRIGELAALALGDPAPEVRRAAARAVAALDLPNKARLLAPLLNDSDEEIRRLAIREVAQVSFRRYLESFDKLPPGTRQTAARALAKIDATMLDRLAEEIGSLEADRRLKALQIVDYVDAEKDLRAPLVELLADPDPRVRATVIKIVELSGNVEGMKLLIGALSDADRRVRANAIEAFEEIGDTRFVQLLLPFLAASDNRVRANAAKALWNLGRREGRDALEAMLADPVEEMRLSAVWAIGELRYEGFERTLGARAAVEPSPRVGDKIAEVLKAAPEAK